MTPSLRSSLRSSLRFSLRFSHRFSHRFSLPSAVACVLVAASLVAATGQAARADHQNCGANYPNGTLSNGYPDPSSGAASGWAGQTALNNAETAVFATTTAKNLLLDSAGVISSVADILTQKAKTIRKTLPDPAEETALPIEIADSVLRKVAVVVTVAALAALIAETAAMAAQRSIAGATGGENACNSVVMGDMLIQVWVATVERNLASDGPPLAVLLSPTDSEEAGGDSPQWPLQPQHEKSDFTWCPPINLPDELPLPTGQTDLTQPNGPSTGGDCTPTYLDGMLTDPYDGAPPLTVQAVVRDAIAHAEAHGVLTGDELQAARGEYDIALARVAAKRYKDAFVHFRAAYRHAVGMDG